MLYGLNAKGTFWQSQCGGGMRVLKSMSDLGRWLMPPKPSPSHRAGSRLDLRRPLKQGR